MTSTEDEIRWRYRGNETWQIFKTKLRGKLAAKECLPGLTNPRPPAPPAGMAAAARKQMEDDIRKYDEMDMKAFGLITQSMLSCPPGQLILAQMVPDEIGCGLHARPAMALLDARFDRRDVRTLAERLGEVYAAKLALNISITDFVSELTNLITRVLEINADALNVEQQIVRLTDGLSNGEPDLGPLVHSITTTHSIRGAEMTFLEACQIALNFDVSVLGKARLKRIGLKTSALQIECYNCGKKGHKSRDCKSRRVKQKKERDTNVPATTVAATTAAIPPAPNKDLPTCGKCGRRGHLDKDCWNGDPAKKKAFYEKMKDRQSRKRTREDGIRAPSFFAEEKASMIWRVGALRGHLSCYMCVDTGAMLCYGTLYQHIYCSERHLTYLKFCKHG